MYIYKETRSVYPHRAEARVNPSGRAQNSIESCTKAHTHKISCLGQSPTRSTTTEKMLRSWPQQARRLTSRRGLTRDQGQPDEDTYTHTYICRSIYSYTEQGLIISPQSKTRPEIST